MHVKVTNRPPIIRYDHGGRPNDIPFDHQILYDEAMDTTQNICCPSVFGTQHDFPMEYTIENVKIFEKGGQYFLQNRIDTNLWGDRITFDVPLFTSGQNLIYSRMIHPDIGYFSRDYIKMPSSGGFWPSAFNLLFLSIENKAETTLKGQWVLRDLMDPECLGLADMSDGKIHLCRMGEFAEFTLVRQE